MSADEIRISISDPSYPAALRELANAAGVHLPGRILTPIFDHAIAELARQYGVAVPPRAQRIGGPKPGAGRPRKAPK